MEKLSKLSRVLSRRVLFVSLIIFGLSTFSIMSVSSTTVSYNPPSYSSLTPHDPISITSDIDFEVFPGLGTVEDPYVIECYTITTIQDYGIYITDTTKYFTVRNCYVDSEGYGIYIYNVAYGTATVIDNICSNNNGNGITLLFSRSSNVVNNTCNNNVHGIKLWFSGSSNVVNNTCNNNSNGIALLSSGSSNVVNNTCSNNVYSIKLDSSRGSTVVNNTCSNNHVEGIYLSYSTNLTVVNNTCCNNNHRGIKLWDSGSATVVNNTCSNNNYGIDLKDSAFCVVTYNLLQENKRYGIYLSSYSANNTIHHNTFVDNNLGGTSQAIDYGTNNFWYYTATQEGNYWSDYSGTGTYSIDGSASSEDFYPFSPPVEHSTVESTTDKTQIFFTFILLSVLVPLILTKLYSRKRLKID